MAGTSKPNPHISTATSCVRTIAKNSEAAGNGGRKNQRSVRVMNSNRWSPAIASQKIEMNEFAIECLF